MKLIEITNLNGLNVEELMEIKGAAAGVGAGCSEFACTRLACNSATCGSKTCDTNACSSTSCSGLTCSSLGCGTNMGSIIIK